MRGTEVISWAIVLASPINATLVLLWWPDTLTQLKPQTWGAIAYLAVLSQWIGFFALNKGFQLGGVSRVSQTQLLQVFVALGLAHILLGENVDAQMGLFALAVTLCVYAGSKTRMKT
jgi:drug/metabolite transporter (DMT)-like permease